MFGRFLVDFNQFVVHFLKFSSSRVFVGPVMDRDIVPKHNIRYRS